MKNIVIAYCKICHQFQCNNKGDLIRHATSNKHMAAMEIIKKTDQEKAMISRFALGTEDEKVMVAEMRLSSFICEKNVPISCIDSLIPVLRKCFPDSKILQKITLGKQKCSNLIRQGI